MARYIVEPKTGGEVVLNEQAKCTKKQAVDALTSIIGTYKVYSDSKSGKQFVSDASMKQITHEKFGKYRPALNDALASEDYEDTGIIDLTQVREAILSVLDDIEDEMIDWMLFYVYSRSDNVDMMEYKVLVSMLDETTKKSERLSSAKPKRPESSSPDKIK